MIERSIIHSTGARSSVKTVAARQPRRDARRVDLAELLKVAVQPRRAQPCARRCVESGPGAADQQGVRLLGRVADARVGNDRRHRRAEAALELLVVARVADVDDHDPVGRQPVGDELEELLRRQIERDVGLAIGVDDDQVVPAVGAAAATGRASSLWTVSLWFEPMSK